MLVIMNLLILSKYLKKSLSLLSNVELFIKFFQFKERKFTFYRMVSCYLPSSPKKAQLQNIQFAIMLDQKKLLGLKGEKINYK